MRIALTVGHSLLKNGSYTSASGEDCGGVNEYKHNKKLMKKVKNIWRVTDTVLICISAQRKYLPLHHRKNHGN